MKETAAGFLVVLATADFSAGRGGSLNTLYSGVNRIPAFPSDYEEEKDALDRYVFGDIKYLETNLIPDLNTALALRRALCSRRKYDVILCCECPSAVVLSGVTPDLFVGLGYDVAVIKGDYWSIVDDFARSDWAKPFLVSLNENGLFRAREQAENYLHEYRKHQEADFEMPFEVVYVARFCGAQDDVET